MPKRQVQSQLVDIAQEHCLSQVVDIPTRQERTLDILLTNNPTPVTRIKGMPPIGRADHDIVLVEYDIKAKSILQSPRKVFLYKRADMQGLKDHILAFADRFMSQDFAHVDVNEMWNEFKTVLLNAVNKFIPSKMTKGKLGYPWIDSRIRALIRKKEKLYHKARRADNESLKSRYKRLRAQVQKEMRDAYWRYVSNIFNPLDTDTNIEDCTQNDRLKKFWSFMKNLRKDSTGVACLRENGILKTDNKDKADIFNKQFESVYTREQPGDPPSKGPSPYPDIGDLYIDPNGVKRLLDRLNPFKSSGPDDLSARVLKECSAEIAPVLACIFNKSLAQSRVPDDWLQANVVPIYKKGEKYDPANYRPVSLTCICCKSLEHILVGRVMQHLSDHKILVESQHGFRSGRSCETQLVQFIHDLQENLDGAHNRGHKQTDLIIMDFAKAFDKVPHRRLIYKLEYYGIRNDILRWINAWLAGRTQKVVLDSVCSDPAPVLSGVPQGSVLGPILFLIFINDLPDNIHSTVRLFADDCVLYRNIRRSEDQQILQDDLDRLAHWEEAWLMKFNVAKCHSMRVTRHPPPKQIVYGYTLHNQVLENVSSAKYLGVKITDDLEWGQHINEITSKATKTLGFLRRNLTFAPKETKAAAYKTLVRPKLEYAAPVWMAYHQVDINRIEKVQRTAARWTCRRWRNQSHVGEMLEELQWPDLQERRQQVSLSLFYKIHHNLAVVDKNRYLSELGGGSRRTRSHPFQYHRPVAYTDGFKNSFFPRTIVAWNGLTTEAVSSETVDGFKAKI